MLQLFIAEQERGPGPLDIQNFVKSLNLWVLTITFKAFTQWISHTEPSEALRWPGAATWPALESMGQTGVTDSQESQGGAAGDKIVDKGFVRMGGGRTGALHAERRA